MPDVSPSRSADNVPYSYTYGLGKERPGTPGRVGHMERRQSISSRTFRGPDRCSPTYVSDPPRLAPRGAILYLPGARARALSGNRRRVPRDLATWSQQGPLVGCKDDIHARVRISRPLLDSFGRGRPRGPFEWEGLRGDHSLHRTSPAVCSLPFRPGGRRPRWPVRHRVRADRRPARTRAWRRRRRPGRDEMGRTVPAVSLRDPPVARRLHPRCERCGLEPGPRRERPRSRAAGPRSGAVRPNPRVGPRRAAHWRHVELQLTDLVAARTCWRGHRADPAAIRRSSARLGRRSRRRTTRRRGHRAPARVKSALPAGCRDVPGVIGSPL